MTFVALEKAFDGPPREVVYWSLRKKGSYRKMVRLAKSVYDGSRTSVRTGIGNTGKFEIRVGMHQGSLELCCLS